MEVQRTKTQAMAGAMVFGEVVSNIHRTGCPVYVKLALFNAVAKPIETHVNCLRAILSDGGVHYTVCGAVVGSHGCRGVWVAKFNESDTHWYCLICAFEKRANLCFRCRGEDVLEDLCDDMNGTVDEGTVDVAKEEEVAGSATFFRGNKVGSVRVNVEDHVTSAVQFCSIGIG